MSPPVAVKIDCSSGFKNPKVLYEYFSSDDNGKYVATTDIAESDEFLVMTLIDVTSMQTLTRVYKIDGQYINSLYYEYSLDSSIT